MFLVNFEYSSVIVLLLFILKSGNIFRSTLAMMGMFMATGLVLAVISIPLAFYWKADEIAKFIRKYDI